MGAVLNLLWCAVLVGIFGGAASAQGYPERLIKLIVPYPAGGSTDILARAIQQPMSEILGKPIVIENRAGAGGIVGTESVARSAPDGYTLVFGNLGPNAINASLYKNLSYNPTKDFSPISIVASMPFLLVAHPSFPANNVAELIALARAKPGELAFASVGVGSASHVTGALFSTMAGIKLNHVPYRGGAPAVNDVVAGHVPFMFATGLEATSHVLDGRMKVLGVSPKQRTSLLPEAPAISETLPGFEVTVWFGVLAPANTPPEIVARLNDAIRQVVASSQVQTKLKTLGTEPMTTSPGEFAGIIAADVAKWSKVVHEAGITID